jgi:hypothetical protein
VPHESAEPPIDPRLRKKALSRWDNEGGAGPCGPEMAPKPAEKEPSMPKIGDAELGALHIRVIALENLVIALLVGASKLQLDLARDMAGYIAPRAGFAHHPLTTHAAAHLVDLVERSKRFRSGEPPHTSDIK